MKWHVYPVNAIDFGWDSLRTVEQTIAEIASQHAKNLLLHGFSITERDPVKDFLLAWKKAKELAGDAGWEGDFRHDPYVFWVPVENAFEYGFAIKQDNNGDTFVVSPVRLPHLSVAKM